MVLSFSKQAELDRHMATLKERLAKVSGSLLQAFHHVD